MASLIDRGIGLVRGTARQAGRAGAFAAGQGTGLLRRVRRGGARDLDDVTIARKVESTIFRGPNAPKSSVDVNVVEGIVYLRGQVKRPEDVKRLEKQTRAIAEVRGVENLLHLPKTPSPTRGDTPARQRRTGAAAKRRRQTKPRTGRKSVTQEPSTIGKGAGASREPTPGGLAERGKGRQPAPLGSQERPGSGGGGSTTT